MHRLSLISSNQVIQSNQAQIQGTIIIKTVFHTHTKKQLSKVVRTT